MTRKESVSQEEIAERILMRKEAENPENFTSEQNVEETLENSAAASFKARYASNDGKLTLVDKSEPSGTIAVESEIHGANDLGYKNLPVQCLPTMGLFYPKDAQITIRSANYDEIRQWSMIDEGDLLNQVDMLNFIIEKCVRVKSSSPTFMSWKDLAEADRFYIVFKVHEFTFPNGENQLMITFNCSDKCGFSKKVPLSSEYMKNLIQIPEDVMKYYDSEKRCLFVHSEKLKTDIEIHMPTIGGMIAVSNGLKTLKDSNSQIDKPFFRMLPYCIGNWRNVNQESITNLRRFSYQWPKNKFLFVSGIIDKMVASASVNATYICERCQEELKSPIFFRGGYTIKNLFSVSGELDDLI